MQSRQASREQSKKILNELRKINAVNMPCSNSISNTIFNFADEKRLQRFDFKPLERIALGNTTIKARVLDVDEDVITGLPILTVLLDNNKEVTTYYQNDWFKIEEDFYLHTFLGLKYVEQVILTERAASATNALINKFFYDLLNNVEGIDITFISLLSLSEKKYFISYSIALINYYYQITNCPTAFLEILIKLILQNIEELEWHQNKNTSAFENILEAIMLLSVSALSSDSYHFMGQYFFNLALSGKSDQEFNLLLSLCFLSLANQDKQAFFSALLVINNEKGLVENHENFWDTSKKALVIEKILQLNYRYKQFTDVSKIQYAIGRIFYQLGEYQQAIKQLTEVSKKIKKECKNAADYPDSYFYAQLLIAEIYYQCGEKQHSEQIIIQLFEGEPLFTQKFIGELGEFIKDKKEFSQAQFELGHFLNDANSLYWYRLSEQHGSIAGAVQVAMAEYDSSPSKNELLRVIVNGTFALNDEALAFIKELEAKEDPEARLALVRIYYESPAHYDEQKAFELIKKAIQHSVQEPLQLLEEIANLKLDQADAFCRKRIIAARVALGELYQTNSTIGIDLIKTRSFFSEAAEDNNGYALYRLAKLFDNTGNHNHLDFAIKNYGKAVLHGYSDAMVDLEQLITNPLNAPINYKLAVETLVNVFEKTRIISVIELLEKLAKKGILEAQLAFGDLCEKGYVVGKGMDEAEECFSAAIQTDDLYAIFRYGALLCKKGKAHPDFKKGLAHIAEAAYRGYEQAIVHAADVLGKDNDPRIELFVARLLERSKFHQEVKLMWLRWACAGNSGEAAFYLARHFLFGYKESNEEADLLQSIQYFEIAVSHLSNVSISFLRDEIFFDINHANIIKDRILLAFFKNQTIRESVLNATEQYIIFDCALSTDDPQLEQLILSQKERILDHFLAVSSEIACALLLTHYQLFGHEGVCKRLFTDQLSLLQKATLLKIFIEREGFLDYLYKNIDFKLLIPILEQNLKFAENIFTNHKQLYPKFLAAFREQLPPFLTSHPIGSSLECGTNKLLVKWLDHYPSAIQQLSFDHSHIAESLFTSSCRDEVSNENLWKIFQKHQKKSFTPIQVARGLASLADKQDFMMHVKIKNLNGFLARLIFEDAQCAFYILPSSLAKFVSQDEFKHLLDSKRLSLNELVKLILKIEAGNQQQHFSDILTDKFILNILMSMFGKGKEYTSNATDLLCSSYANWIEFDFILKNIFTQINVFEQSILLIRLLEFRGDNFRQEIQGKLDPFTVYNNAILDIEAARLILLSGVSKLLSSQQCFQIIERYKDNEDFMHAVATNDDNEENKPVLFEVLENVKISPSVHSLFAHRNVQSELMKRTEKTYKTIIKKWFNIALRDRNLNPNQQGILSNFFDEFNKLCTISDMHRVVDRMLEEEIITEKNAFTFSFYKSNLYVDLLKIKEMLNVNTPEFELIDGKVCIQVDFRVE